MNFRGQITAELPEVSGVSKSTGKAWRRKTYVLTYDTSKPEYPKSVVIDVMGDKVDELKMLQGHWYDVEVDFSSREFGDKWYMSATAWRATEVQNGISTPSVSAIPSAAAELAAAMQLYPTPEPKAPHDPSLTQDLPF